MVWDSASPRHKKMAIDYYDRKLLHSFMIAWHNQAVRNPSSGAAAARRVAQAPPDPAYAKKDDLPHGGVLRGLAGHGPPQPPSAGPGWPRIQKARGALRVGNVRAGSSTTPPAEQAPPGGRRRPVPMIRRKLLTMSDRGELFNVSTVRKTPKPRRRPRRASSRSSRNTPSPRHHRATRRSASAARPKSFRGRTRDARAATTTTTTTTARRATRTTPTTTQEKKVVEGIVAATAASSSAARALVLSRAPAASARPCPLRRQRRSGDSNVSGRRSAGSARARRGPRGRPPAQERRRLPGPARGDRPRAAAATATTTAATATGPARRRGGRRRRDTGARRAARDLPRRDAARPPAERAFVGDGRRRAVAASPASSTASRRSSASKRASTSAPRPSSSPRPRPRRSQRGHRRRRRRRLRRRTESQDEAEHRLGRPTPEAPREAPAQADAAQAPRPRLQEGQRHPAGPARERSPPPGARQPTVRRRRRRPRPGRPQGANQGPEAPDALLELVRLTNPGRRAWEGTTRRSPAAPTLVAARCGPAAAAAARQPPNRPASRLCPRPCAGNISSVVPAMWLSLRRTLRPVLAPAQVVAHRCFSKRGCRVPRAPRRGALALDAAPRRFLSKAATKRLPLNSSARGRATTRAWAPTPRAAHGRVRRRRRRPPPHSARAGKFIIDPDKVVRPSRRRVTERARVGPGTRRPRRSSRISGASSSSPTSPPPSPDALPARHRAAQTTSGRGHGRRRRAVNFT